VFQRIIECFDLVRSDEVSVGQLHRYLLDTDATKHAPLLPFAAALFARKLRSSSWHRSKSA